MDKVILTGMGRKHFFNAYVNLEVTLDIPAF